MVKINELIDKLELTEKERLYLETLIIHEDREMTGVIARVKQKGGDVKGILQGWLDKN